MSHPKAAAEFNKDENRVDWHDKTLWFVRSKRDKAAVKVEDWESLRTAAENIKAHVLSNLDNYLIQFEENAKKNGIHVHWAADASEHNEIVLGLLKKSKVKKVVKSKSMLTEECHLNPHLEKNGIEVVDTDLGEWIVQLAKQRPSHIVMPAIHMKKGEIDDLFHEKIGTKKSGGDEKYLAAEARKFLRQKFLGADASITGVNFAVADKGGIVVCTNEGNADMGVHLTPIHIACMGIEKIIPHMDDLGVFLRLLGRSATGQPITAYSSHFFGPRKDSEMHIVIVDNGRTEQLGRKDFRKSLHCIRCGACMNTCPIYRKSGGHSYEAVIPGPIGSILSPGLDLKKHSSLPFASTLCGSCTNVCPVKIDIHDQLYKWRQIITENNIDPKSKKFILYMTGKLLSHPRLYNMAMASFRIMDKILPLQKLNIWGKQRAIPSSPPQTFSNWYAKNRKK